MSLTDNPRSLESLRLQRDYHLRQQDVILIKREQYKNYKKAIENQRLKKLDSLCNNEYDDNQDNESMSLQVAIYRTMEETDSLLGLLFKKGSATNSDSESLKSFSTTDTDDRGVSIDVIDSAEASSLLGSKHPKDDSTVIEELRILNGQLHSLVNQLVTQLDARVKEVDRLKETIKHLESDKSKGINKSLSYKSRTSNVTAVHIYLFRNLNHFLECIISVLLKFYFAGTIMNSLLLQKTSCYATDCEIKFGVCV